VSGFLEALAAKGLVVFGMPGGLDSTL